MLTPNKYNKVDSLRGKYSIIIIENLVIVFSLAFAACLQAELGVVVVLTHPVFVLFAQRVLVLTVSVIRGGVWERSGFAEKFIYRGYLQKISYFIL